MAVARLFLQPTLFFSIIIVLSPTTYSLSDSEALLKLKDSFTNAEALNSWSRDSAPCQGEKQWDGLICYNGIVTGLRLEGFRLSGKIDVDALLQIRGLRTISIMNNNFSGSIPEFNRIGVLKTIYLSKNQFSGEIPSDYFVKMGSLKKVWLSENKFMGEIPSSLAQIPVLIELHLENNEFSGKIPNLDQKTLKELDVSNNNLEGEIPFSFSKFNASSFEGNSGLCGAKLGKECAKPIEEPPATITGTENNVESSTNSGQNVKSNQNSTPTTIAFIATSALVVNSIIVLLIVRSRKKKNETKVLGKESTEPVVEVQVTAPIKKEVEPIKKGSNSSSKRGSNQGKCGGVGELVVVNDEKGVFVLSDLMKAAAEVLGNGGLGSSYKAVMANGVAVVVKRMREMNALGKDGFDAEMKRLGQLKHWNVLTPLAYLYRKDEKLLVYEYVPKGSLLYLLHGDRGPSHAELDWPARLRIVQGIAKGMHYLHTELASELPHGNLKSSNVLLGPDYEPLLSDYGFIALINTINRPQGLFAYKAPEAVQYGQVSPKCDVYCFGIVILEILTGKFPSQYLNNGKGGTDVVQWVSSAISERRESEVFDPEIANSRNSLGQMEQLLHIGASCAESNPAQRLDIMEAIRRIEEIQTQGGGQDSRTIHVLPSLRDGYADSVPPTFVSSTQGLGEQSGRRLQSNSLVSQSGRQSDDNFVFAIP
ncbi:putative Receptor-like kinase [Quillaja saponaria]|uniref:Receptor-like kinase n=1 Tax=Quillaja saponaria TaxID=32244 RepID=A0AAD7PPE7_QUISA|nr:putative Receptor-like kinase [Quillaja saponaria]